PDRPEQQPPAGRAPGRRSGRHRGRRLRGGTDLAADHARAARRRASPGPWRAPGLLPHRAGRGRRAFARRARDGSGRRRRTGCGAGGRGVGGDGRCHRAAARRCRRTRRGRRRHRHPDHVGRRGGCSMSAGTGWKAGLASLAMLAVAAAGSVGLVAAHDIDLSLTSPTEEMAADESQAVPTLVGTDSPAMLAVQEVLTTAPQGWEVAEDAPRMGTQRAWWPAVEHSGSPVVAGSVVMSSPAGDVVVDAAAYPAGLGAVAMEEKAAVAEPSNGPGAQGAVA